jgi:hypothetical protein
VGRRDEVDQVAVDRVAAVAIQWIPGGSALPRVRGSSAAQPTLLPAEAP